MRREPSSPPVLGRVEPRKMRHPKIWRHRWRLFISISILLFITGVEGQKNKTTAKKTTEKPKIKAYPNLECHPGYDKKKGDSNHRDNVEICDSETVDSVCWKFCIQNSIGITDESGTLQTPDKIQINLYTQFFSDKKTASAMADKIVFDCKEKWKANKKKKDCNFWGEFIECVDKIWLCQAGVPSLFSSTGNAAGASKVPTTTTVTTTAAKGPSSNTTGTASNATLTTPSSTNRSSNASTSPTTATKPSSSTNSTGGTKPSSSTSTAGTGTKPSSSSSSTTSGTRPSSSTSTTGSGTKSNSSSSTSTTSSTKPSSSSSTGSSSTKSSSSSSSSTGTTSSKSSTTSGSKTSSSPTSSSTSKTSSSSSSSTLKKSPASSSDTRDRDPYD